MPEIVLRAYEAGDADALADAVTASLPDLSSYLPWAHDAYGREDARRWIAFCADCWLRGSEFPMGIFGADGQLLGGVGLNKIDASSRTANLGYWVRSDVTGRGVATEAARQMARRAFEELGFRRLEIVVLPENHASAKVAEKLGALDEGIATERLELGGVLRDARVFSLAASHV